MNSIDSDINVRVANDRSPVNERSPKLKPNRRNEEELERGIRFVGALKSPELYRRFINHM